MSQCAADKVLDNFPGLLKAINSVSLVEARETDFLG